MNLKNIVKGRLLLITLIGIGFYAVLLLYSEITTIEFEKIQFNWYFLPIILLISFSLMFLAAIRYHLMLKELDVPINLKDSLFIALIGQSMLVTPGRIGNYIKCFILKKTHGTPLSTSSSSVIAEQILELLTATILISVFSLWVDFIEAKIISIIGFSLITLFFMVLYNSQIFILIKKIIQKISFLRKFSDSFDNSRDSLKKLFTFSLMKKLLPLSLVIKAIQVILILLVFQMLDIDFGFIMSGIIYNTSLLVGAISFIPGGIIVTDASMLSLIIKNGVDFSIASVSIIVIRFFTLWFNVIIGFVAIKFSNISLHENDLS